MFEEKYESHRAIFIGAEVDLEEYQQAQASSREQTGTSSAINRTTRWQKPGNGFFKANRDVALDGKNSNMGVGVVIRNWEEDLIATLCISQFFAWKLV